MSLVAFLTGLHWREPLWLLLALQPLLLVQLRRRRHRARLATWADPALQPWALTPLRRRHPYCSRQTLWILAWLLFAVAAAGPRKPLAVSGAPEHPGIDIMVVLDLSRSMQATDVPPSRLQRARIELLELLDHVRHDRIGIILYAGQPHLFVPLTFDRDALRFYLERIDEQVLPFRGSRAAPALALAQRELAASPHPGAVLLISDGDFGDHENEALPLAARRLHAAGIPLYVLGVGTVEGAAIAALGGGWLRRDGRPVISRMNEKRLAALAATSDGRYRPVADDDSEWTALYDAGIARLASAPVGAGGSGGVIWQEYYPWALLPAIVLAFLALMPWGWPRRLGPHTTVLAMLFLLATVPSPARAGGDPLQAAYAAFARGDHATARDRYAGLSGYAARLGEGASRYRLGDYPGARRQFAQAALAAANDRQRATALYNLGNSLFRLGDYAGAARTYEDALRYRPNHAASRHNRKLSLALQARVAAQLQQEAARRAGRGPRRAGSEQPIEVDANAALTLDDGPDPAQSLGSRLPTVAAADPQALVQRGIEHARLAAEGDATGNPRDRHNALDAARFRMRFIDDERARLWKHLFEMEAGFPGSLDEPRVLPGVAPW